MSQASLCPVCNGKGVVYGIAETGAMPTTTCHGCDGKGWVEVGGGIGISPELICTREELHATSLGRYNGFLLAWNELCHEN